MGHENKNGTRKQLIDNISEIPRLKMDTCSVHKQLPLSTGTTYKIPQQLWQVLCCFEVVFSKQTSHGLMLMYTLVHASHVGMRYFVKMNFDGGKKSHKIMSALRSSRSVALQFNYPNSQLPQQLWHRECCFWNSLCQTNKQTHKTNTSHQTSHNIVLL